MTGMEYPKHSFLCLKNNRREIDENIVRFPAKNGGFMTMTLKLVSTNGKDLSKPINNKKITNI